MGQVEKSTATDISASAASMPYAIDCQQVSKIFTRSRKNGYSSLKSLFIGKQPEMSAQNELVALKELTMRVPKGASCGVIGRNGSGKSTLLKLITGIYRPTSGSIAVNGRIAALIELGAGFHPDFTGRENLSLSAVMLGLTNKEIAERYDDIVDFAELSGVMDQPVRTYSSGMFMRLGFSIAVHTEPDVLLIDEVLSVGDVGFVKRCQDRLAELKRRGTTMLIVSHDLAGIERWSDEVIWIHKGCVKDRGEPRRVIDAYRMFVERDEIELQAKLQMRHKDPYSEQRWGSREVEIVSVTCAPLLTPNTPLSVRAEYVAHDAKALEGIVFGFAISNHEGGVVCGTNTQMLQQPAGSLSKSHVSSRHTTDTSGEISKRFCTIDIDRCSLLPGKYGVEVSCHRADGYPYDHRRCVVTFVVEGPQIIVGAYSPAISFGFSDLSDSLSDAPSDGGAQQ